MGCFLTHTLVCHVHVINDIILCNYFGNIPVEISAKCLPINNDGSSGNETAGKAHL